MNSEKKSLLFRIGLGRRAGKVSFGTDSVCEDMRSKRARLVLIAENASDNTKKRILNCAAYYNIPTETLCGVSAAELGSAIGKSTAASISLTDENIVKLVKSTRKE